MNYFLFFIIAGGAISLLAQSPVDRPVDARVDFNRDVRPILNKNCTSCHGGVKKAGGVSFILREQALGKGKSGLPTVVPGDLEESELFVRITLPNNDEDRMPPIDHHPAPLSPEEIATLQRWIEQGADWGEHWAFLKPEAKELPVVMNQSWPEKRIDFFTLAKMESEALHPSAAAGPREWLRRVSFGLTGLPPTAAMMERVSQEFDQSVKEEVVEELLASPAFGERWAAAWMDVARYSDSKGYEKDQPRIMWPYRDWLIRSFQNDLPYPEFVKKQLAGDLLPEPSMEDFAATGFLRSSQTNVEGGTDDEEFRVVALIDRINTTWTAFQGVTFGCVQCHAHPYDPIDHKEFFEFADFFNNLADCDLGNDFPTLKVPNETDRFDELSEWQVKRRSLEVEWVAAIAKNEEASQWVPWKVETRTTNLPQVWLEEIEVNGRKVQQAQGTPSQRSIYELVGGIDEIVEAVKIESLMEPGTSSHTPSKAFAVTQFELQVVKDGTEPRKLEIAATWDDEPNGFLNAPSWGSFPNQFHDRWAVLLLQEPVKLQSGEKLKLILHQNLGRDGAEPPVLRRFALSVTSSPDLRAYFQSSENRDFLKEMQELDEKIKATPGVVMPVALERTHAPRSMAVFNRGNFLDKTEPVSAALPAITGARKEGMTRLEMANWMAGSDSALTSRVWVNRVWSEMFGIGLVETLEDFGSTGTPPSHPDLLDDLAVRFQSEMSWSLKNLLREIALSATWSQTSKTDPELVKNDPQNRLLARGPRQRLSAEMVRDHALAVSGLLSSKRFGPSVKPPQPEGLWNSPYSGLKWDDAEGEDRYRRALYTFWRRGTPYPSFQTFDVPERRVCSARRIVTSTPLQALVTLNDPVYLEAAQVFAQRMAELAPRDPRKQIRSAYELATSQDCSAAHEELLVEHYHDLLEVYRKNAEASAKLGKSAEDAAMTLVVNAILNLDSALTW